MNPWTNIINQMMDTALHLIKPQINSEVAIQLNDGEIAIVNIPGSGATFTVEIPVIIS